MHYLGLNIEKNEIVKSDIGKTIALCEEHLNDIQKNDAYTHINDACAVKSCLSLSAGFIYL